MRLFLTVLALVVPLCGNTQTPGDQQPFNCDYCSAWNEPATPYQLAENTWYVGTRGLSSVLIVDSDKLALIDGALPQSVEQILNNIKAIGFDPTDIEWILNSHPHFDHAGGIAALARITGAQVVAGEKAVIALEKGPYHPDDPQAGFGDSAQFPTVTGVRSVANGDTINLGDVEITAIASPGHAPGGMSWTWQSCPSADDCIDVVYLDSLNAVSADDYRYTDHPRTLADLEASIDRLSALPCDVAIAAHPDGTPQATADASICAIYADKARQRLERRLAEENKKDP